MSAATTVVHAVTITAFETSDATSLLRAECLCGWHSPTPRKDRVQAMLDGAQHIDEKEQPTRPACPPWCGLPTGHFYDSVPAADPEALVRFHELSMPGSWTVARQETWRDGVVTLGPVQVSFHSHERPMTVEQARQHAAALVAVSRRPRASTRA